MGQGPWRTRASAFTNGHRKTKRELNFSNFLELADGGHLPRLGSHLNSFPTAGWAGLVGLREDLPSGPWRLLRTSELRTLTEPPPKSLERHARPSDFGDLCSG